ncbi:MAG: AfsR/SARP family transcriptional regulator, partial [Ilumatobacteraceae bacterium]
MGPLSIVVDAVERSVTAPRQRAVLAFLAVHAGEGVSADRLLDAVWGEDVPAAAAKAVAFQISKLRSVLEPDRVGEGSLITTSSSGYLLGAGLDDVDAHRFERLVAEARGLLGADPAGCEVLTKAALGLWRGRPFADLNDEPFVRDEIRRLEQLHQVARRTLAEARIACGRHVDVVSDLQAMVVDQPLDEAVVGSLMVALQRSGRTADALRAFGDLRVRLSGELGIEPSNDLKRLERELLDGGPEATPGSLTAGGRQLPVDRRTTIPAAPTSFIGRGDDIAGIRGVLLSTRVLTLCGFGGLGKTRLAQEIANAEADRFDDGVWYVDLTSINDPYLLVDTFLVAGDVDANGHDGPTDRLLRFLAGREVLVVVDNCEHLVEEVASLVVDVVRAAPQVRVLATSRVALGVPGEATWMVSPLEVASSADLLIDRTRLARPGFVVDEANREAVERLATNLDGIPLAIEMAAARLGVMSIGQVDDLLDDRFGLLTGKRRGVDEKQRSLAAVMDWTYDLLDEAERGLLRRLSVCVGGFDLDAAVRIGATEGDDSTVTDVVDRLGRLVDASLVEFNDSGDRPRYRILETVREYAGDRLDALDP